MNIFTTIVLPLISSLIGGGMTLLAMVITIKHENKINRNNYKLENKPMFYPLDVTNKNKRLSLDIDISCSLSNDDDKDKSIGLYGVIKNTDKALLVIKKISVNNKEYLPDNKIFEKNQLVEIFLLTDNRIKETDKITLTISDLNDNEYTYKVLFASSENEYKDKPVYLIKIKEK